MWKIFLSRISIEITSADNIRLLNELKNKRIQIENVLFCDDLTMHLTISAKQFRSLYVAVKRFDAKFKLLTKSGILWTLTYALKRPILTAFFSFLLACSIILPTRVFFLKVEGNSAIPDRMILEVAQECGIKFGASRRKIRSEMMKNALLHKMPDLEWAGINTSGCTAIISVKEKTVTDVKHDDSNQVSSIIASRDGIIQSCTVYRGNSLCTVGQAVKAGQKLVSGYIDCGIMIKTTQADAEIKAYTFRELRAISPTPVHQRGDLRESKSRYRIIIGKKSINLFKDSGNIDTNCGKMYERKYLCLPGGFTLPVGIIKETFLFYEENAELPVADQNENWLSHYADRYLQSQMVAGTIISSQVQEEQTGDAHIFHGEYACLEMIGQVKYEQMLVKGDNYD